MTVSLASLLIQETQQSIYNTALSLASAIGLPVSSWQAGDPTRSLYWLEAEELSTLESVVANFISSGFLDYASGVWLQILALEVFNVTVPAAVAAEGNVTLTNNGGGVYPINPGDLTVKSSVTGATFHNTAGGLLASGGTLTLDFIADVAGSSGTVAAGQIDTMVTTLLGVTCSNPLSLVGVDQPSDATIRQLCRDKLGSFSPNGPAEAYAYVARTPALAGTSNITRVRVYPNSTTGQVQIYLANASGPASGADVAAVTTAIATWATPLCITPAVAAATANTVAVTYTAYIYTSANKTVAQAEADILAALQALFSNYPIGGAIVPPATTGDLFQALIQGTIQSVYPAVAGVLPIFRVVVSAPAADVAMANSDVAVLGTVTPTIVLVAPPNT